MNIYSTTQMEFLTDSNAKFIQHILRKYRDDESLIIRVQVNTSGDTWEELKLRRTRSISFSISKKHVGETLKHKDFALLVLGKYRLYVFVPYKKELKVCHNVPLTDIERIEHLSPSQFRLKTTKLDLRFLGVEDEVSEFLIELYTTTVLAFPGLLHKIDLHFYKEAQATNVKQTVEEQFYSLKCGGFVKTYEAICSYLEIVPRFEVCWDVDNLYHFNDVTEFRLSDFKSLKLQFLDYKAIFHSLHFNLYFKSLSVDIRLDKDLLNLIPPIFAINSSLNSLTLKSCGLSKDLCSAFRRAFEQNNKIQLEYIDFSDSFIEEKGLVEILKYVETSKIKLSHFDVSNCNISEKGMYILAGKLYDYREKLSLSCLNLAGNKLDPNSTKAFSLLFDSIFNLNLSSTNPDFPSLGNLDNLIELNISHCNKTLKDLEFLSSCFKLKKLNLSDCNITSDMLKPLFSKLKLEELDLSDNAQSFGDQVYNGYVLGTEEKGVIDLVEILKGNSGLKILKLNRNFESKVKFQTRQKSVESLIELCKFSCQYRGTKVVRVGIETLEIIGATKYSLKESILPFIYSLLTNQTLRTLDITGNHVGDALGIAMAKVLQTNAFLEEIYMDDNQVTDFSSIRNALHRNRSLKFFQHPSNDVIYCCKLDKSCKSSTVAIVNEIQTLVYKNCLYPVGMATPPGAMTPVEERVRMTEMKKRNSTKFVIDVGRASSIFVTSNETSPVLHPPRLASRDSIEEDTMLSQEKISIAFENMKVDSPMNKRHLGDRSLSLMELHRPKAEVYRYDTSFVQ